MSTLWSRNTRSNSSFRISDFHGGLAFHPLMLVVVAAHRRLISEIEIIDSASQISTLRRSPWVSPMSWMPMILMLPLER